MASRMIERIDQIRFVSIITHKHVSYADSDKAGTVLVVS